MDNISLSQIITILAVISSALSVYFSLRKFGDNIKKDAEWRTEVNFGMKNILDKIQELLISHKNSSDVVNGIIKAQVELGHRQDGFEKEQKLIWGRIDEHKNYIAKNDEEINKLKAECNDMKLRIAGCENCRPVKGA